MDHYKNDGGRQAVKSLIKKSEVKNIEHLTVFDLDNGRCILTASSIDEILASSKVLSKLYLIVINYREGYCITHFFND